VSSHRRRTTLVLACATVLAAVMANGIAPQAASAAVACDHSGSALSVTMTVQADRATFLRGPNGEIEVNDAQCGTATVENVEEISVTGADGWQRVRIDLAGGPFASSSAQSDPTIADIRFSIDLGAGSDGIDVVGTSSADTLVAGAGGINLDPDGLDADVDVESTSVEGIALDGRGDNDTLSVAGDSVTGAPWPGSAYFVGGDGDDTLTGGPGVTGFEPRAGDDTVLAGDGTRDHIWLGGAPGPLSVDLGAETATGEGSDTVVGIEEVYGSPYDDELTGDDETNQLWGEDGADIIHGGGGLDYLLGDVGDDTLDGGAGSDRLYPSAGDDGVVGGEGAGDIDTISYTDAPGGATVDLAAGTGSGNGVDTIAGIEEVLGSPYADVIEGGPANELLHGNGGDDVLSGRAGNDTLVGAGGADVLVPGADNDYVHAGYDAGVKDTVSFEGSPTGVTVNLFAGTASGEGTDAIISIETVRGSGYSDVLKGGSSSETFVGGDGNDDLDGGDGDDVFLPGTGNDTVDGGGGMNTLAFDGSPARITVAMAPGTASGEGADVFAAIQTVRGSAYADVITGADVGERFLGLGGADMLRGGGGVDELDGGVGNDLLRGDAGADALSGGSGMDAASYASAPARVTVKLALGNASGGAGADSLAGIENVSGSGYADLITGTGGANTLSGAAGRDVLSGAGGNDRLYGGTRADSLFGGRGNDRLDGGAGRPDACYQGRGSGRQSGCELP
jgi:Ca2+-binding RTX toxin-like protein